MINLAPPKWVRAWEDGPLRLEDVGHSCPGTETTGLTQRLRQAVLTDQDSKITTDPQPTEYSSSWSEKEGLMSTSRLQVATKYLQTCLLVAAGDRQSEITKAYISSDKLRLSVKTYFRLGSEKTYLLYQESYN